MRPKKRFDEISAVHFSSPATSSFRDSHEKRKSKSDGNELVDVHVDGSSRTKPDSPFTRIINLDQGYDQSQASSKSLNSKEKTSPNSKWLAVAGLGLGMILVFVSFTEGSVSQHAITTSTGGENITNLLPSWLHQSSPTSSEKSWWYCWNKWFKALVVLEYVCISRVLKCFNSIFYYLHVLEHVHRSPDAIFSRLIHRMMYTSKGLYYDYFIHIYAVNNLIYILIVNFSANKLLMVIT